MLTLLRLIAFGFVLLPVVALRADDAESAAKEARMREALQNAYGLLRTAQDQAATLQAAQADSDKEKTALKAQIQSLTDQLKAVTTKSGLDLQAIQADRDQLKMQVVLQQRKIDEDETRNVQLYELSNEILTRYEKFGLGEALEAKEPFTGLARTHLENLVQDYQDKIMALKAGAPAAPGTPAAASATAASAPAQTLTPVPAH